MVKLIARWIIAALALLLAERIVPGISVSSFYIALVVIVILAFVNAILRPVAILLTLPITIVTFGLFVFVINAALFWFVSTFIKGFEVEGFVAALLGSVIVSIASFIGGKIGESSRKASESQ